MVIFIFFLLYYFVWYDGFGMLYGRVLDFYLEFFLSCIEVEILLDIDIFFVIVVIDSF